MNAAPLHCASLRGSLCEGPGSQCHSRRARAGRWGCYRESGTLGSRGLERALDFALEGYVLSQVFGGQDRQRGWF